MGVIKLILISTLFVGLVLAISICVGAQDQVLALLTWLDGYGFYGPLLSLAVMALVVILLLPGVLFTTGAGFAFGVVEGSVIVVLGTGLGATVAFLLARYAMGERAGHGSDVVLD